MRIVSDALGGSVPHEKGDGTVLVYIRRPVAGQPAQQMFEEISQRSRDGSIGRARTTPEATRRVSASEIEAHGGAVAVGSWRSGLRMSALSTRFARQFGP